MDQRRKRRRLLPSARIVKEEAWERLAPVLQYAHERPFSQMLGREFLRHEGKSETFYGGANQKLHVIDDQRPVHRYGQFLFSFLKLPPIDFAGSSVAVVDAAVARQVARRPRPWFGFEIGGRTRDRR